MTAVPADPSAAALAVSGDGNHLALEGVLGIRTPTPEREALQERLTQHKAGVLDLSKLGELDTSGALFLCEPRDHKVELTGVRPEHAELLALLGALERKPLVKPAPIARWRELAIQLGRGVDQFLRDSYDLVAFVGRITSALARLLIHPSTLRPAAITRQIAETGINALAIVGLLGVMSSVVIGYQSVTQLRPYGSEGLTIDLIAVSVLREMGVLITAILVAGRSGSAFTAEIGVMKTREEIDALHSMGLDPMALLVLPRVIGLMITLPLLALFADISGLVGGAMVSQSLLQITWLQYFDRVRLAVDATDLFVGLIKAPVFAFAIAAVGCMHGLKVRGSAESVGRETTRAVVKAIFLVIVLDGLFSVLFERLGL